MSIGDAEQVRRWAKTWKFLNAFEITELRQTPPAVRLRQFFSLMEMGKAMGFHSSTPEEDEVVRLRWQKLREAYRG
jgi:hypothetical protein